MACAERATVGAYGPDGRSPRSRSDGARTRRPRAGYDRGRGHPRTHRPRRLDHLPPRAVAPRASSSFRSYPASATSMSYLDAHGGIRISSRSPDTHNRFRESGAGRHPAIGATSRKGRRSASHDQTPAGAGCSLRSLCRPLPPSIYAGVRALLVPSRSEAGTLVIVSSMLCDAVGSPASDSTRIR